MFLAPTVAEIWRRSYNFKIRSRDPFPIPFDQIFHFLVSTPGDESACQIWRF